MTGDNSDRCDFSKRPYGDFDYPRLLDCPLTGRWSADPAHFRVEELPLYPFAGDGEHAALIVEKESMTTRDLSSGVAKHLGLKSAAVGYAGMKDKDAVTVQAFTVTGVEEGQAAEAFEACGAKVVSVSRHRNKLRLGHLAGNRFSIFIEGGDGEAAAKALEELAARGAPNYFGPQRFGAKGDNARRGMSALAGKVRMSRWQRDLMVSAVQSVLFNEVLARRIEQGLYGTALTGDVLKKTDSGGIFVCEDVDADQPRLEGWEVSPTGPIFGKKMVRAAGEVEEGELSVLADMGLEPKLFSRETGTRRPLRVPLQGAEAVGEDSGVWLKFTCPAGTFATSVVREIAASGVWRD